MHFVALNATLCYNDCVSQNVVRKENEMKYARQTAILTIIEHNDIETQEDLAARLRDMGIMVTQATVSRDIKELRLLKVLTPSGVYKYATAAKAEHGVSERLVRMFIDSVLSITYAENLVVIHTLAGSANAAAEAIDSMRWPEILGTMAGDNTIFVAVRSAAEAPVVVDKFHEILQ